MWRKLWKLLNTPLGKLLVRKTAEQITEKLQPTSATASVAKHNPAPGTAVVEVYNAASQLLTMDTVKATPGTPAGSYTFVSVPHGPKELRHLEFVWQADTPVPFPMPAHLKREDAAFARIWWSMEAV